MGGRYFTASRPQSVPGCAISHANSHTLALSLVSQDHLVLVYVILYAKPHTLALSLVNQDHLMLGCVTLHAKLHTLAPTAELDYKTLM